jgi:ABC-2 type transport system permease protein|tara:strand:+ start:1250 stop:2011 length:762 start_codon:yes stop_codon:yes gene_type:complete
MINYYGTLTLTKKEVFRFLKVYHQTILSPIINSLLLLAVFSISVGNKIQIGNLDFQIFMASGLIIMTAMQNAFANSSSSLVMGKVLGHIVDYLIPPLGALEIILAFTIGSVLRGIMVGIVAYVAIWFFLDIGIYNFFYIAFCLIFGSIFLGLLGILCGILSDSFDHMSAITSYLITPLTFLSGTFYSTKNLPETLEKLAHYNPFFYIIDGFRYGITGYHDSNLIIGIFVILGVNILLFSLNYKLLKTGYRIKN